MNNAKQKGYYVSIVMKGTYKLYSGSVEKVGDVLTKLKNDKGHIMVVNDDIRVMMTYEGDVK